MGARWVSEEFIRGRRFKVSGGLGWICAITQTLRRKRRGSGHRESSPGSRSPRHPNAEEAPPSCAGRNPSSPNTRTASVASMWWNSSIWPRSSMPTRWLSSGRLLRAAAARMPARKHPADASERPRKPRQFGRRRARRAEAFASGGEKTAPGR
jgi:hypothetical protein